MFLPVEYTFVLMYYTFEASYIILCYKNGSFNTSNAIHQLLNKIKYVCDYQVEHNNSNVILVQFKNLQNQFTRHQYFNIDMFLNLNKERLCI